MRSPSTRPLAAPAGTGRPWVRAALAVGTVVDLELRQRVRSTAWYVLLGISAALLLGVTLLLLATAGIFGRDGGPQAVSAVVFFVLLLGTLVTPALSGGAINGDRDAGTLATTQVTLIRGWQLVLGKFLAAWTASLAFLAVALPFLLVAAGFGGADPAVLGTALAVTTVDSACSRRSASGSPPCSPARSSRSSAPTSWSRRSPSAR